MEFQLPEIGEGVYEAELVEWLVKPGDVVGQGDALAEVMTDKATMQLPSPFSGKVTELRAAAGDEIKIGEVILTFATDNGSAEQAMSKSERQHVRASEGNGKSSPNTSAATLATGVKAAPSVRRMARQLGIELSEVRGSGPGGRILIDDLTSAIEAKLEHSKDIAESESPDTLQMGLTKFQPGTRVKLKGLRRKIAQQMVLAKQTAPHYSYVDECNVSELVRLRASLKETAQKSGVKLTYLAFFVKAVVEALREAPLVNATLADEEIVLHDRYNIGIATNTPDGLIVPVIHDADKMEILQVAREIELLSSAARSGKATIENLRGGTFTITSIGNIGGLISTPIINHPEVGIMGVGKIMKRPIYDNTGNIQPADMLYLSFSFDHRVVDGAVGAAFGNSVIQRMQNPAALLL